MAIDARLAHKTGESADGSMVRCRESLPVNEGQEAAGDLGTEARLASAWYASPARIAGCSRPTIRADLRLPWQRDPPGRSRAQDPCPRRWACRRRGPEATLNRRNHGDRLRHLSPRKRRLVGRV